MLIINVQGLCAKERAYKSEVCTNMHIYIYIHIFLLFSNSSCKLYAKKAGATFVMLSSHCLWFFLCLFCWRCHRHRHGYPAAVVFAGGL